VEASGVYISNVNLATTIGLASSAAMDVWALVEALQFQAPTAAQTNLYVGQINAGAPLTQIGQEITQEPFTLNVVDPLIREYEAAFGRAPDQAGLAYWAGVAATSGLGGLSAAFANSQEFFNLYGVSATTPASTSLVEALYQNILGHPGDAAGVNYWSSHNLNARQLLQVFSQSAEFIADSQGAVAAFQQSEAINAASTTLTVVLLGFSSATNEWLQPTTTDIAAIYEAVQFQAPTSAQTVLYEGKLTSGYALTQVALEIAQEPFTLNVVDPVIREYLAAFGHAPDQAGLAYWVGVAATSGLSGLSAAFANSQEFFNLYGVNADAPASTSLVEALYQNILGHAGDAAGVAYWSSQNLNAGQLLQVFSQSAEFVADTQGAVASFQQSEIVSAIAANDPPIVHVDLSSASHAVEVWGGTSETIDVSGSVSANTLGVLVADAVTNAPSTGNPFLTTITLNAPSGTNIELMLQHPAGTSQPDFEGWAGQNATNSQVNVAAATTLAQALDIAAGQAVSLDQQFSSGAHSVVAGAAGNQTTQLGGQTTLADWFQFQGNTFIVEANNSGLQVAPHAALGAGDVVVELTGIVNVAHLAGVLFT
jgi:hypothetical protein